MSPEDEKRLGWWALAAYLLACILAGLIGSICRADSTFVPIEPPKPTVDTVRLVCKSCGHCIPRDLGGGITLLGCLADPCCNTVHERYECQQTGVQFEEKYADCSVIVWGRWRQICRVDTTLGQMHEITCPEGRPGCAVLHFGRDTLTDTIYTDDPRCRRMDTIYPHPNLRARGLDSTFVLGHDTCWSIPSKHPRLTLDTCMKIPNHWEYFNWINGKRVNMRRVK